MSQLNSGSQVPPMPSGSIIPGAWPNGGTTTPQAGQPQPIPTAPMLPMEQSYIENILRMNRGRIATVYTTFENNTEWNALVFRGVVEEAGRDHLILSDPETGENFLLRMINVDYITFDEPLNYIPIVYPGQQPYLTTAPPRPRG